MALGRQDHGWLCIHGPPAIIPTGRRLSCGEYWEGLMAVIHIFAGVFSWSPGFHCIQLAWGACVISPLHLASLRGWAARATHRACENWGGGVALGLACTDPSSHQGHLWLVTSINPLHRNSAQEDGAWEASKLA